LICSITNFSHFFFLLGKIEGAISGLASKMNGGGGGGAGGGGGGGGGLGGGGGAMGAGAGGMSPDALAFEAQKMKGQAKLEETMRNLGLQIATLSGKMDGSGGAGAPLAALGGSGPLAGAAVDAGGAAGAAGGAGAGGGGGAAGAADAIANAKLRAQMNVMTGALAKLVGEVEGLKSQQGVDAALAGGAGASGAANAAAAAAGAAGAAGPLAAMNNQLSFMASNALTNAANAVTGAHNAGNMIAAFHNNNAAANLAGAGAMAAGLGGGLMGPGAGFGALAAGGLGGAGALGGGLGAFGGGLGALGGGAGGALGAGAALSGGGGAGLAGALAGADVGANVGALGLANVALANQMNAITGMTGASGPAPLPPMAVAGFAGGCGGGGGGCGAGGGGGGGGGGFGASANAMGAGNNKAASGKRDGGQSMNAKQAKQVKDRNANAVLANIMSDAFATAGGNPLVKIALGGGLERADSEASTQDEKKVIVSENAKRRYFNWNNNDHQVTTNKQLKTGKRRTPVKVESPKRHQTPISPISSKRSTQVNAEKHSIVPNSRLTGSISAEKLKDLLLRSGIKLPKITMPKSGAANAQKRGVTNAQKKATLSEEEERWMQSQRFHSNNFEQDTNQILGIKPGADDILKTVGAMQLTGKLSKCKIIDKQALHSLGQGCKYGVSGCFTLD